VLHAPREEVGYEDVACLPPPETTNVEPFQVPAVRSNHIVSRVDAPSWHDPTNIVSTFGIIENNGLCFSLNSVGTIFLQTLNGTPAIKEYTNKTNRQGRLN
jgi:hypothetical protein